jgi:hypothetical protein
MLVLLLVASCKTTDEGDSKRSEPPKTIEGSLRGIVLHCVGLQPPRKGGCDPGDSAVTALVLAARTQMHREEAVDLAMHMPVGALPLNERIIAQNAALYLGTFDWTGRIDALRLVRALAYDKETLHKLGSDVTPEIGLWLDDPRSWRDQKVVAFPLLHEKVLRFTQFFRAVISGSTRAIVGQLVALDKDWDPHVTPIVGGFEALRAQSDDANDLAACITEIDVEARRCGAAAGLDALMVLDPPPQNLVPFVLPYGGSNKANCRGCHDAPPNQFVEPLDPQAAPAHLSARRDAFLREARAQFQRLREVLREAHAAATE